MTDRRPATRSAALVGFARTLRAAGVDASPDRVQAMVAGAGDDARRSRSAAATSTGPAASRCAPARTTCPLRPRLRRLVRRRATRPVRRARPLQQVRVPSSTRVACWRRRPGRRRGRPDPMPYSATASEPRCCATATWPADRPRARRAAPAARHARPARPRSRPSRRHAAASRGGGSIAHRTVRAMLAQGGEPARLAPARPADRPRRLVLLLDVSGSMAPYADALLRFAHAACAAGPRHRGLHARHPADPGHPRAAAPRRRRALAALSAGRSRTGAAGPGSATVLQGVPRPVGPARCRARARSSWSPRTAGSAATPTLLGEQMARLHRLAHRVVWVNPHRARPGFEPATARDARGAAARLTTSSPGTAFGR